MSYQGHLVEAAPLGGCRVRLAEHRGVENRTEKGSCCSHCGTVQGGRVLVWDVTGYAGWDWRGGGWTVAI